MIPAAKCEIDAHIRCVCSFLETSMDDPLSCNLVI